MRDQHAHQGRGGLNQAAMQRGGIGEGHFHQGARHKEQQHAAMKATDGARLVHVQREDAWHGRPPRRVEPWLAALEVRGGAFQEHAEGNVANALCRHAPQRALSHIGAGADVEEAQVVDGIARQRGVERLLAMRRGRPDVVDRTHPLLPGQQAQAGVALHAELAVHDARRKHRRLWWQPQLA